MQLAALTVAVCAPGAALSQSRVRSFDVPEQAASAGVSALARQADAQILISAQAAEGRRTRRVAGSFSTEEALDRLLEGTGLRAQRTGPNTFSVLVATAPTATVAARDEGRSGSGDDRTPGIPDVLVTGRRGWSLNTGIQRTRDDSQPFVVFDQAQIRRTGATSLEAFLRDYLNSNAAPGSTEQAGTDVQGRSTIDLRGLGRRETLILVDGRRQPGLNVGSGETEQAPISNIPLAAIERIEVLASSASGIYGAGATGGVINVVLRRDYRGVQITANYLDTTDFKAPDIRLDVVGGLSLENGRTTLSFNGSIRRADPLRNGERRDLLVGGRAAVLANNPDFFGQPPLGATPNIRSASGLPLQLDPQYGGTILSSANTFVPPGYRGVALDGVGPLVANAGRFNLDLADLPTFGGAGAPLIYGTDQMSGTVAIRREMASWLKVYGEASGTMTRSRNFTSLAPYFVTIPGNAPNNPFQRAINVTAPLGGLNRENRSKTVTWRAVGGAIATLPFGWQAVLDASLSKSIYTEPRVFQTLLPSSEAAVADGTFDLLQDTSRTTFPFQTADLLTPDSSNGTPQLTATLKLAGPVPISLPGGRPVLTLNLEHDRQKYGDALFVSGNRASNDVYVSITPARSETLDSAYGEIRVPLVGEGNHVPLVRGFEITVAGRYERYHGVGSGTNYVCFSSAAGFPDDAEPLASCDLTALDIPRVRVSNSRFDPTYAARWEVARALTLRGSYARGYLPPRLSFLIPEATDFLVVLAADPRRGGEAIGEQLGGGVGLLPGFTGGNAAVRPERSRTFSVGAILTPPFLRGLRFSADYTSIVKRDVYYQPNLLLYAPTAEGQRAFETFLELYPDRFTRGPASDGFQVGPITSIDASLVNLARTRVRSIDFALDYATPLWGGTLDVNASATRNVKLDFQVFPGGPVTDITGVAGGSLGNAPFASPNLKWRGNAAIRWSNHTWSLGVRGRYVGPYFFSATREVDPNNGSATLDGQLYFDVFGTYAFGRALSLRAGVNNVLDKRPPYVSGTYSGFGDPRLANFYLALTKSF